MGFYSSRATFFSQDSALQQLLLAEFHSTPVNGHASIRRTQHRIASTFSKPHLKNSIRDFIQRCIVCQIVIPFNHSPQGLLKPLPIPGKIRNSASLDFITHLSTPAGKTVILVVVNRLSKQAHFICLTYYFTTPQVAKIFVHEIMHLHGIPAMVVPDCNPIFMS